MTQRESLSTSRIHIRTVNGEGQRCGCGERSVLRHHVGGLHLGVTDRDIFLCVRCAQRAMEGFIRITGQQRYGEAATEEYR